MTVTPPSAAIAAAASARGMISPASDPDEIDQARPAPFDPHQVRANFNANDASSQKTKSSTSSCEDQDAQPIPRAVE